MGEDEGEGEEIQNQPPRIEGEGWKSEGYRVMGKGCEVKYGEQDRACKKKGWHYSAL
jgi:hypothetical protein